MVGPHSVGGLTRLQPQHLGDPIVRDEATPIEDFAQTPTRAALVLQALAHVVTADADQRGTSPNSGAAGPNGDKHMALARSSMELLAQFPRRAARATRCGQ